MQLAILVEWRHRVWRYSVCNWFYVACPLRNSKEKPFRKAIANANCCFKIRFIYIVAGSHSFNCAEYKNSFLFVSFFRGLKSFAVISSILVSCTGRCKTKDSIKTIAKEILCCNLYTEKRKKVNYLQPYHIINNLIIF